MTCETHGYNHCRECYPRHEVIAHLCPDCRHPSHFKQRCDECDCRFGEFQNAAVDQSTNQPTEVERLRQAIRTHRDQRGDDRCWQDDETLYNVLPEGYTPPVRDTSVELELCQRYIASRHNPATTYISPQREIDELYAKLRRQALVIHQRQESWQRMREKSQALVNGLAACMPAINGAFGLIHAHGGQYSGPTFGEELKALTEELERGAQ